ncbi:RNA polymerase sigma factor [Pseudoalteromonas sp. B62]|uniref:RNA polymerase sigma factor n=1 Tax=Pseudoalteromonas sp. B62 TaxID=630483 RepID=UPI00301BE3B4
MFLSRSSHSSVQLETNPHLKFWVIWSDYEKRVRACCYKWLYSDQDRVEDAMAQACEKALKVYIQDSSQIENMFAWLCRIAHNICMDIHRLNSKESDLVKQANSSSTQFYFTESRSQTLESEYERIHLYQKLMDAINDLPNDLKQVIQYKFIYEMEYSEIANQLQISQENARKRVQLARKKLSALQYV